MGLTKDGKCKIKYDVFSQGPISWSVFPIFKCWNVSMYDSLCMQLIWKGFMHRFTSENYLSLGIHRSLEAVIHRVLSNLPYTSITSIFLCYFHALDNSFYMFGLCQMYCFSANLSGIKISSLTSDAWSCYQFWKQHLPNTWMLVCSLSGIFLFTDFCNEQECDPCRSTSVIFKATEWQMQISTGG